jgi:predicted aspartyl protease
MEPTLMGRVRTEVAVENMGDLWDVKKNILKPDQVRRLLVKDALVDTGATTLALPTRLIQQLGLSKVTEKRVTSGKGSHLVNIYDAVRVTIMDRFCTVDVTEVPDDVPVLVGQIPLEMLDLVVDPQGGRLTGNPAHGGEHVLEMYLSQLEAKLS